MKTTLAGQIHDLLVKAQAEQNLDGSNAADAWAAICHTNVDDPAFLGILIAIKSAISKLAETVMIDEQIQPAAKQNYLKHLNQLQNITHPKNLVAAWVDVKKQFLTAEKIEILTFLDDKFWERHETTVLDESDANELLKEFSKLFDNVANSNIDERTKQWILSMLREMIVCLYNYKIYGVDGVAESILKSVIAIRRSGNEFSNDDGKKIMTKIKNVFGKTFTFLDRAEKISQQIPFFKEMIKSL